LRQGRDEFFLEKENTDSKKGEGVLWQGEGRILDEGNNRSGTIRKGRYSAQWIGEEEKIFSKGGPECQRKVLLKGGSRN